MKARSIKTHFRKITNRSGGNYLGRINFGNLDTGYESLLESNFMYLARAHPNFAAIESQSTQLIYEFDGKQHTYTSDVEVVLNTGESFLFEVKPFEHYVKNFERFEAIKQAFNENGREFDVITDLEIENRYLPENARLICYAVEHFDDFDNKLLQLLSDEKYPDGVQLQYLMSLSNEFKSMYRLLSHLQKLGVNLLFEERITPETRVKIGTQTNSRWIWEREVKTPFTPPQNTNIAIGDQFIIKSRLFKITDLKSQKVTLSANNEAGKYTEITNDGFAKLLTAGRIQFYSKRNKNQSTPNARQAILTDDMSYKDFQKIQKLLPYLHRFEEYRPGYSFPVLEMFIEEVSDEIQDESPPSASKLYRWIKRKEKSPEHLLTTYTGNRGNRTSRLDESVLLIIKNVLEEKYLQKNHVTMSEVVRIVAREISNFNRENHTTHSAPSRKAIETYLNKNYDPQEIIIKQTGKKHLAKNLYSDKTQTFEVTRPLQLVEIDNTPCDVWVIKKFAGRVHKFRPNITAVIDVFSRCITGVYLSIDPSSNESASKCLIHSIQPKQKFLSEIGLHEKIDWPVFGIPQTLVMDQGLDFWASRVGNGLTRLGIEQRIAPPKSPTAKPHIERFFKTLTERFFKGQPGFIFSPNKTPENYDPKKCENLMTFEELQAKLLLFITKDYHHTDHSGIGTTPINMWIDGLSQYSPALLSDCTSLPKAFSEIKTRKLRKDGIRLNSLFYNHGADERYKKFKQENLNKSIDVAYYASDIRRVWIISASGEYIEVLASPKKIRLFNDEIPIAIHTEMIKNFKKRFKTPPRPEDFETVYKSLNNITAQPSTVTTHTEVKHNNQLIADEQSKPDFDMDIDLDELSIYED
ncbi:TnsA endonuclease N-terminal domain-containing protein [Thiomicrorhabdus indica]|uniref:TnsA endonuclease N-terminal domain-containing protein n=1 Tax=Thiomicrorhabdus indica TaxID=2267253 RepID=UPI002AA7B8AB|nr:TnsA endonuclease N-terminal domain-containing protein [Thiomicrorhabdus indica]